MNNLNANPDAHRITGNGGADLLSRLRHMTPVANRTDNSLTIKGRLADVLPEIPDNFTTVPFEVAGVVNPAKKAILSNGYPIAVVAKDWHLLPHREVVNIGLSRLRDAGFNLDDCYGRLRVEGHGAKIRLDIVVPEIERRGADGSLMNGRFRFNSGLDGHSSAEGDADWFRLMCLNGMGRAFAEIGSARAIHSLKSIESGEFVHRLLTLADDLPQIAERFDAWAGMPLNQNIFNLLRTPLGAEEDARSILDAQLGTGAAKGLAEIMDKGSFRGNWVPGMNSAGSQTVYDVYNGVTYMATHKSDKMATEDRLLRAAAEVVETYLAAVENPEPIMEAVRGADGIYAVAA